MAAKGPGPQPPQSSACPGRDRVIAKLNQLQAAGDNVVVQYLGPTSLFPDGNNPDSPYANLKVRQALGYAINSEAIAKTLGFGYWKTAYQFSTPASKAYDPAIAGYKYDPAKAKQLLAEGAVGISRIGQDKYGGRVDADVSTARTADVATAMLERGFARRYSGGRRQNWCG